MASKSIVGLLNQIGDILPPGAIGVNVPPPENKSTLQELVFVVYYVGDGYFSTKPPQSPIYINLQMNGFDFQGKWIGYQHGVHESHAQLPDLLHVPPAPGGYDEACSDVPTQKDQEWTKGLWTFADGSSITAVGPAQSHLIPLKDGNFHFMVTTGQTITNGTGIFEGCSGIKQATGSAVIPGEVIKSGNFPPYGQKFPAPARTIETFRVILSPNWADFPTPESTGMKSPTRRKTSTKKSK